MNSDYESKKARLQEQMRHAREVRLGKETSNLFRGQERTQQQNLSVRDFNHVLWVNVQEGWAEVEGMTTYADFVDATLPQGMMPAVVPELKSITVGGAASGVGIEATSFRYGLVHETVLEMEILLADGSTVLCSKDQHADLFYGFPNSYGTFGYALKLKVKLIPTRAHLENSFEHGSFVKIEHARFEDFAAYFSALAAACASDADFVDGVIFGPEEMYVNTGKFAAEAPFSSDYTYLNIYYKSIREKKVDFLSVADFIWRWDTDWFWCSNVIGAQNPLMRRLLGKKRLNSLFYNKLMRWSKQSRLFATLNSWFGRREEWVIQDVDIPIENAARFAEFFFREVNIRPVWTCPIQAYDKNVRFSLYSLDPKKLYVNFGFWSAVPTEKEQGYYNKLVEAKVSELQGKKGLYSDSYYTPEEFWNIYDKSAYDVLKQKYDPQGKLKNLFEKAVKRQ